MIYLNSAAARWKDTANLSRASRAVAEKVIQFVDFKHVFTSLKKSIKYSLKITLAYERNKSRKTSLFQVSHVLTFSQLHLTAIKSTKSKEQKKNVPRIWHYTCEIPSKQIHVYVGS